VGELPAGVLYAAMKGALLRPATGRGAVFGAVFIF